MTQRDLERLKAGEIDSIPPSPVYVPQEPLWSEIEASLDDSVPQVSGVEERLRGLINELNELQRQFSEKIALAINSISGELRGAKASAIRAASSAKSQIKVAQKNYSTLETKLYEQIDRANQVQKTVARPQRVQRPQHQPPKKDLTPAPCWARSQEPVGKLNCGCQGAPVAYQCSHPEVGGFVTLHAASLRDTLLRKADGTTEDIGTRHLKPCSLCQHRSEVQGDAAQVTGLTLTMRTAICDNCQLKPTCVVPGTNLIKMPETACPDGRWAAETPST